MTEENLSLSDTAEVSITRAQPADDPTVDDPGVTDVNGNADPDGDPSFPKNDAVPESDWPTKP